nr:hypothetical protein [Verrucomicrobiota bacterium]
PILPPRSTVRPWQNAGQLQYTDRGRSVIGEVVVARAANADLSLDFYKGPGIPLLKLWRAGSGGEARAQGALARGAWRGDPAKAPARLTGWLNVAEQLSLQTNLPGRIELSPAAGERFIFVFAR